MTKINYTKGDLLDAPEYIIVHGANSLGVMSSGVALAIKKKYPSAFKHYKKYIDWRTSDPNRSIPVETGDLVPVRINEDRLVINAITQYEYGRDKNRLYADYEGFRRACINIRSIVATTNQTEVAMPFICCGLANGSWSVISNIIEEELISYSISVNIYYMSDKEKDSIINHDEAHR